MNYESIAINHLATCYEQRLFAEVLAKAETTNYELFKTNPIKPNLCNP